MYKIQSPLETMVYSIIAPSQVEFSYYSSSKSPITTYISNFQWLINNEIDNGNNGIINQIENYNHPNIKNYHPENKYLSKKYHSPMCLPTNQHEEYQFDPNQFLKPGREGKFIGEAKEIQSFVESTFEKIFSIPFPSNIEITILAKAEFQKLTNKPGVIGLSINRKSQGLISEVFVLQGTLARVMLTVGHELGHVLTPTLPRIHDEEAKAYAFSFVWMQIMKENNIANLAHSYVTENPAYNGLHDVACNFVLKLIRKGTTAREIYNSVVHRVLACPTHLEQLHPI